MIVILIIAFQVRKKLPISQKKHLIPFIIYRFIYAFAFALIHIFYFGGGDTFVYFDLGNFFADQILSNPGHIFELYQSNFEKLNNIQVNNTYFALYYLKSHDSQFMGKIVGIVNLLSFKHFLSSTLIFSLLSSIGLWHIFSTFSKIYPKLTNYFAIGTLYFPTIAIWSSGILKDPIVILSVGLILSSVFNILNLKHVIRSILLILLSIYLCQNLKPYVLYIFLPSMLLWAYGQLSHKIKKGVIKVFLRPIIFLFFVMGGYLITTKISNDAGKYSIENIENVTKGFHSWHQYLAKTRNQSGYSLGEIEFTPIGILKKAPQALMVTFFRPYLFIETHNSSTFFEGIQSFILLLITLFIIIRVGFKKLFQIIFFNPHVRAILLFALIFGFAVGFTSYNFGALSRYKIPALPFFTTSLTIIYFEFLKAKKAKYSNKSSSLK